MEHEDPKAVSPQVFDFSGEPTMSVHDSEMHYGRPPSMEEPVEVKDQRGRERRGEGVW